MPNALADDAHNLVVLIQRNTVRATIAIVIVPALEDATGSVRPRDDLGSAVAIGVREVDAHWIGPTHWRTWLRYATSMSRMLFS